MYIKHLPSGLFPHFDSGFERRPLYPKAGEVVKIGCRLDGAAKHMPVILRWKVNGNPMPDVVHIDTRAHENSLYYYTFEIPLPDDPATIEYSFAVFEEDGTKECSNTESVTYVFESLHEIQLSEPSEMGFHDKTLYALYSYGQKQYQLKIEINSNISIIFSHYLNGKVVDFKGFDECVFNIRDNYTIRVNNPLLLRIEKEGTLLAEYKPIIKLSLDRHGRTYQIEQSIAMTGSAFYGFGEKFDHVNQKGLSPLSYVVEQYSNQQDKSYIPIPFFFTDHNVGFLQNNTWKTQFSIKETKKSPPMEYASKKSNLHEVGISSRCPREGILYECTLFVGEPREIIRQYTSITGELTLPPKWAFGPWMSSNGWNTQKESLEQIAQMNELSIPATVLVLEAWSDEETFYIWNDAKYTPRTDGGSMAYEDFTFTEEGKWPNPKEFANAVNENGLKLVLWQIPVVKYERSPHCEQLDLDTEYAINQGLCVKNADGSPYRITEMWFGNSLIPDFTNPETLRWWFDKRKYLVSELGVSGFKTDGGEFLFDESSYLYDGRTIEEAHSDFPNLYVGAYHNFLNETLGNNQGVTFSRAGYTGAGKYPIHWAGDQVSTFSELRGQLMAGLSIGLSGVPFWSFDLGGFAGDFPSTELYLRSAAFGAFAPVMQFHSEPRNGQYYMTERKRWNNDRTPWNMAIANDDERIIEVYRLFANLRMNLLPYLWQEANYCVKTSRPMMAHLIYDYPMEESVIDLDDEYMLGRDLLVAPIIAEGAVGREIWLPKGVWYDFWSGLKLTGGTTIYYECQLNKIPVFVREGAFLPLNINHQLKFGTTHIEGAVSNRLDEYETLCIALYGGCEFKFEDDLGTKVKIEIDGNQGSIEGNVPENFMILPVANQDGMEFTVNGRPVVGSKKSVTMFDKTLDGYLLE